MKKSPLFQVGSLLLPNEYLRNNNEYIFGVIIQVRKGIMEPFEYELFLTNGIRNWHYESRIQDLFDVHCCRCAAKACPAWGRYESRIQDLFDVHCCNKE